MTRGDIYSVRLPAGKGHEQSGSRYSVIVQADEFLRLSTAIVAPASSAARATVFRPEIEIGGEPTRVLVEQLRVLDIERLGEFAGHLSIEEQRSIDEALSLVLGLSH